jgi:flagellum-specific peptidoglycan hydrolase FlgJ
MALLDYLPSTNPILGGIKGLLNYFYGGDNKSKLDEARTASSKKKEIKVETPKGPNPYQQQAKADTAAILNQNAAFAQQYAAQQPKFEDITAKFIKENPLAQPKQEIMPNYSDKDLQGMENLVQQVHGDQSIPYPGATAVTPPVTPTSSLNLPGNQAEMLSNLKTMAANAFPDNPMMQQVALTQAIHESGLMGKPSDLALTHNNLFGIKASRSYPGTAGNVDYSHIEYVGGKPSRFNAGFSANLTPEDSFNQYKNLITGMSQYQPVVQSQNPEAAFNALQKSGYATDPTYASKLNNVYRKYVFPLYQQ